MRITIDTADGALSATEKEVLRVLLGDKKANKGTESSTPAKTEPPKGAPAKTEPPKAPAKAEPSPEQEESLLERAARLGQQLVNEGKAERVREALQRTGARRVTQIPEDKVAGFLEDLSS